MDPLAGLPDGTQAEDFRQAVAVLNNAKVVPGIIPTDFEVERINRVCDILNFLGTQFATIEAFARAKHGMEGMPNIDTNDVTETPKSEVP